MAAEPKDALWRLLEHKISTILDAEMRRCVVRERLAAADATEFYEVIQRVLSGPHPDAPEATVLRDLVLDLLSGSTESDASRDLSYEQRRDLYAIAAEHQDESAMRLLRSQPGDLPGDPASTRVPKELQEIPLGVRRSLAKQDDPRRLEQLSRDPDPIVIRHLLRNARLRERDVVAIAARRPALESTLLEIANSPRWSRQPRVRVALARNPHTPIAVATRLVATMPSTELRAMKNDPDLHNEVQRRVEKEIARRAANRAEA